MELRTRRCALTAVAAEDLEAFRKLYTDPRVRRFLGGPRPAPSIDEHLGRPNQWAIRIDASAFIGCITLGPHHEGPAPEVSYLLLPQWWGAGYAGESVRAVLAYAQEVLRWDKIIAETQTANSKSIQLLKRVGMRFERSLERFGEPQSIYTT